MLVNMHFQLIQSGVQDHANLLTFCFKSDLQELFFKYSWNNFLHAQVEKCITTVLNNPPTEEDGEQSTPLVDVVSYP